jgi:hypothetical protein
MAKTRIRGVKVPKKVLGRKLRKGTRKDIADLVRAVGHPDARSVIAAATAALLPLLADRMGDAITAKAARKLKAVG